MRPLVIVDSANVVGSRPDGWWRDRAGAARRLLEELRGYPGDAELVLVTEGRARIAPPDGNHGPDGRVTVVHAPGSGDDRIVELVAGAVAAGPGRSVTVVTADRGLRDRVTALGAATVGPRWLWDRLDRPDPT
ncbi:hypothetical protein AB0M43_11100 [Longispora sp. NPDC051575]|uniref:hypothetical protein n=1 Tax=Longispora sp. NPDC051575 TaxID=3154943 RepID=UPI003416E8BA